MTPNHTLSSFIPLCRSLHKLLPGLVEVVLHDLESNTIVHIENAFTPRKAGDDSLLETANYACELEPDGTIGPYRKSNPDGGRLKSVSSLISDEEGRPIGLLCINMRVDALESVVQLCETLVSVAPVDTRTMLRNDWRETSNAIISDALAEKSLTLTHARRQDRLDIVQRLNDADIFSTRGSSDYIAGALGISRASLYQLLRAARDNTRPVSRDERP